jgi:hypothetical protein
MTKSATSLSTSSIRGTAQDRRSVRDNKQAWKSLEIDIDLYKFYIQTLLKAAGFIFAVTGAIVSFYLSDVNHGNSLRLYSLVFPFLLNAGFCFVCFRGIGAAEVLGDEHGETCGKLGFAHPYDMTPLPRLVRLFALAYGLVTVGLIGLFVIALVQR